MRFLSEEMRLQHPVAKLLPKKVYDKYFQEEIPTSGLQLMQLPLDNDSNDFYSKLKQGFIPFTATDDAQKNLQDWLCFVFGHADESTEYFVIFGQHLNLTLFDYLEPLLKTGQHALFLRILNESALLISFKITHKELLFFLTTAASEANLQTLEAIRAWIGYDWEQVMHMRSYLRPGFSPMFYDPNSYRDVYANAYYEALRNGNPMIADKLKQWSGKDWNAIVACAFCYAVKDNEPAVIEQIKQASGTDIVNRTFHEAMQDKLPAVIEVLYKWAPKEVDAATVNYFSRLQPEAQNSSVDSVHALFIAAFSIFLYAARSKLFNPFVDSFVKEKLTSLYARKEQLAAQVISVGAITNEAKYCLVMINHLIRRNDPADLDDLGFLMGIPAVRSLLHRPILSSMLENEQLQLAIDVNNLEAERLLLAVPRVREVAARNNTYKAPSKVSEVSIFPRPVVMDVVVPSIKDPKFTRRK